MTLSDYCHTQFAFYAPHSWIQVPSNRERTQHFQSQAYRSRAMWPCCDFTSSDDDEHITDNIFLTDVGITPTLLESLTKVDVLHKALSCRFALDFFTISQQPSPTPNHVPLPHDPSSPHFEHGCGTCFQTVTLANLLGPRSWKGTHTLSLTLCVAGIRGYTVSTQDTLTCTAPVLPALSDYSIHPRRAHLAVMVTPTHTLSLRVAGTCATRS